MKFNYGPWLKKLVDDIKKDKIYYDDCEEIHFETDIIKYTVYAPTYPPFTTLGHTTGVHKLGGKDVDTTVLLSSNVEQVLKLFACLREGDEKVIEAWDWTIQNSIVNKNAYLVLCYDFAANAPYVEFHHYDWC